MPFILIFLHKKLLRAYAHPPLKIIDFWSGGLSATYVKIDTEECNSYLQFINIFSTLDETSIIDFTGYYFKGDISNFIKLLTSNYGGNATKIIKNTSVIINS